MLSDPAQFDRQEVSVTGQVTILTVEEGDKPYTKFKLQVADETIPVFMRGAHLLTEGQSYEIDGVFVVKPASDGSEQVSGIVGQSITAIESSSEGVDEATPDGVIGLLVGDLLDDPTAYDRQEVRVSGDVTRVIIEEGDKPYTKFKIQDESGEIPVFMRGAQPLTEGDAYEVDGVFLVKPASDESSQVSGIVAKTIAPLEDISDDIPTETQLVADAEDAEDGVEEPTFEDLAASQDSGLLVGDLLDDPTAFDREDVALAGEVTTLVIEEGDKPYTKFKLQDASGEIPVFMRGVQPLIEGESYEVDGVFLVKPSREGAEEVSGIVARAIEPLEAAPETVLTAAAETPEPAKTPAYTAPSYEISDLLADQNGFDRQFVSVTGQVTTLTTRYGEKTYQKFKLQDESGTIPVFIPGTSSCQQGQICKVTGVFLIKRTKDGESEISGIKADAIEKIDDAPYREWTSLVFQQRTGGSRYSTRVPRGFAIPE